MFFGKKHALPALQLYAKDIEWVDSWTYLGVNRVVTSFCGLLGANYGVYTRLNLETRPPKSASGYELYC